MCLVLNLEEQPIKARSLNKKITFDNIEFFGQKIFTIIKKNNKIYLSGWSRDIIYDINLGINDRQEGLILTSPDSEQDVDIKYKIRVKDYTIHKFKEITVNNLGMHFTIENDKLNYCDIKNDLKHALKEMNNCDTTEIQNINLIESTNYEYRSIKLPVFACDYSIKMFGCNNEAISSELIIPNTKIFLAYLKDCDNPDIGAITSIMRIYTKLYNKLKKLGNITCA